jgi:hypothetical protein
MARHGEHFFMCFFTIWIASFEKAVFSHLPIFSLGHWFGRCLVFWAPYILNGNIFIFINLDVDMPRSLRSDNLQLSGNGM